MHIKNILLTMMLYILTNSCYACDYNPKILDLRVDTLYKKIWSTSEIKLAPNEIDENLDFVKSGVIIPKKDTSFEALCEEILKEMKQIRTNELGLTAAKNFDIFVEQCKLAYEQSEEKKQSAVSLLLQNIFSKSKPMIRLTKRKTQLQGRNDEHPLTGIEYFLKADKSSPILPIKNVKIF